MRASSRVLGAARAAAGADAAGEPTIALRGDDTIAWRGEPFMDLVALSLRDFTRNRSRLYTGDAANARLRATLAS